MGLWNKRTAYQFSILFLFLLSAGLISYKLFVLNYSLAGLVPVPGYTVEVRMDVTGHGEDIEMSTYLPLGDDRQRVSDEQSNAEAFVSQIHLEEKNRILSWHGNAVEGQQSASYSYFVQAEHIAYSIDPALMIPTSYPGYLQPYLVAEEGIEVGDPLIKAETQKLFADQNRSLLSVLTRLHHSLQKEYENRNFSGFTSALTALKLKEASCNGKSRLFVAMARTLGIPARLVGGLILDEGSKRTSHQWAEAYVGGHWVPFDAINNHAFEIPANYLTLYYGDKVLFKHTANVNFQYRFTIDKKLVPRQNMKKALSDSASINAMNVYWTFEQIGISQNLLQIILMIPLGALVVVIFRNVIGLETFGTFLPALIAAASRETGLFWGLLGFFIIIILSSLIRRFLDWMGLLHSPKMAIMLTAVVIIILAMTIIGVHLSLFKLAHVSLFPIAILAITAERFALIEVEQGLKKALAISLMSAIVIAASYAVMSSLFLESMILAFPELLLVIIILNLWLGKWVGLRLSEFIRFRKLIFKAQQ